MMGPPAHQAVPFGLQSTGAGQQSVCGPAAVCWGLLTPHQSQTEGGRTPWESRTLRIQPRHVTTGWRHFAVKGPKEGGAGGVGARGRIQHASLAD